MRKQSGYIYRKSGWWILRYREDVMEGGQIVRKQVTHRLEQIASDHARLKRPPQSIKDLAEKFLRPLNDGELKPESTQTIGAFVDSLFLPQVKQRVRQSTYKGYVGRWESQLKARCGSCRLDQRAAGNRGHASSLAQARKCGNRCRCIRWLASG